MPLTLDASAIDRFGDRALHRQLADRIREAIKTGVLRPGEALPSESDLSTRTDLSRTTVRNAMDELVAEGLIVKRSGAATRVVIPPPVRHMATARYQNELDLLRELAESGEPHPLSSAFTDDHGVDWGVYSVQAAYSEDAATEEDALRLDVAPGVPVLRRQLVKLVADRPVQLQDSVIPLELVAGTPVADPQRQPWPGGTIAELWSVGLEVTHVSEEARARTPRTAERRLLEMEAAGAVWDIVRTFYVGHGDERRPVEYSTVVCPVASIVLMFATDLH
jgi:GntR family transcriptional regulator